MAFDLAFLAQIRAHEIEEVLSWLRASDRILEVGAGNGLQSLLLSKRGRRLVSIDVPESMYEKERVFPVLLYDGSQLPFREGAFDVVFSSSVLEHVKDRPALYGEFHRVLRPGGGCVHIVPTPAWRFWTSVAHYVELARRLMATLAGIKPSVISPTAISPSLRRRVGGALVLLRSAVIPPPHGEDGSAWRELWSFSARRWAREFRDNGFDVTQTRPLRLFYTGHMVLGARLSMTARRRLAGFLGSACRIYRLTAVHRSDGPSGEHAR